MPNKIKKNQYEDLEEPQGRDFFQTPNYATDLLAPFLNKKLSIWECAAGYGKMSDRLVYNGFKVLSSTLEGYKDIVSSNFLSDPIPFNKLNHKKSFYIVTNPPFSLKKKFYLRCLVYGAPFALLIPWDMSGWLWNAYKNDGCQAIIPSRRVDFITPTGKSGKTGNTANYHSFWLTRGLNLKDQLNFVELTNEMKENI